MPGALGRARYWQDIRAAGGCEKATPARSEAKILERNLGNYASDTHLVEDVF